MSNLCSEGICTTMESPPETLDALTEPIYGAYAQIRSLVHPGTTVLDIGCGNGKVGAYLSDGGATVDGIEPSANRAEVASSRLRYVSREPAATDGSDPLLAPKYDLVTMLDVVEHIADPAPVLAWAASRVKTDGKLIVLIPNSAHWRFRTQVLRGDWRYQDSGLFDRTHLRFYDPNTARELKPPGMQEVGTWYFSPGAGFSRLGTRWRPRLFALHVMIAWTPEAGASRGVHGQGGR